MSGIVGGVDDAGGRVRQYDLFADEFLDHAESGFFNAYYDRPACLALLGDVAGKRVLDAACGPGYLIPGTGRRRQRLARRRKRRRPIRQYASQSHPGRQIGRPRPGSRAGPH
jgi:hypothetical protein